MRKNNEYAADKTTTEPPAELRQSTEKARQEDKDKKPQPAEKCECPPGCIGLPCCT